MQRVITIITTDSMKRYANLRKILNAVAVISITAISLFAGCTTSDNTLGYEIIPENQKMQIRFKSFYAGKVYKDTFDKEQNKFVVTEKDCRAFRTSLFRSDSLVSSNLQVGYMGVERDLDNIFGKRNAGYATNFLFMSDIGEEGFGYLPIFDSLQLLLSVKDFAGDTTYVQTYEVFEVTKSLVEAMDDGKDTVAYIGFDMEQLYDQSKPLFTFRFPNQEEGVYTTSTAVTMQPVSLATDSPTWDFIRRLMLIPANTQNWNGYADDTEVYTDDKKWVEAFKGLYVRPVNNLAADKEGAMYKVDFSATGIYLLGRNRNPEEPRLIKDTTYMYYYFYDKYAKVGNYSINSVKHDFTGTPLENLTLTDDKDKSAEENRLSRSESTVGYISGMGGPMLEIYFSDDFLAELRNISAEDDFSKTAINQAMMSVYLEGSNYDWLEIQPDVITPLLDKSILRMGLYTDFDSLTPIPDYNFTYEKTYDTALAFGGLLNRSRASYVMDISGYVQCLKNYVDFLNEDNEAGFDYEAEYEKEENKTKSGKYIPRTIYLAPEAYDLYTFKHSRVWGMEDAALQNASIKINLSYTMIK